VNKSRRKRIVEIYFILYLAALVFLLPDKPANIEKEQEPITTVEQGFQLLPEKASLFCKVAVDSIGYRIIEIDSLNTVFFQGPVDNLSFEVVIEDKMLEQTLILNTSDKSSTKFFKIDYTPGNKYIVFKWFPTVFDRINRNYLVQITAIGESIEKDNGRPLKMLTSKSQFSLNLIYIDNETGKPFVTGYESVELINSPGVAANAQSSQQIITQQFFPDRFSLIPEQTSLSAIAWQNFSNTVYASNINLIRDLAEQPKIKAICEPLGNGGEAFLADLSDDKLIVRGKTPSYGSMRVEIKIKRKQDGAESINSFVVKPMAIEQPIIPKTMYPEKTYLFDPRLPLIGGNLNATLKFGERIIAASHNGERFSYTPDISDTGRTFQFERYIDGSLYGQVYKCRVVSYPQPEIIDIQRQSGHEVIIIVKAYGTFDRKENEITGFIIEGNAKYQDLRGKILDEPDVPSRTQHFRFTPKNPEKPFEFSFSAIDRAGRHSVKRNFKE